ncbi:MAG: type III-B CRISPR module-associated Cmr3 family protein, partial [Sciscionella sp.]
VHETSDEGADDEHWDLDASHRRLSHALTGMGEPVGGWITSAGLRGWLSGAVTGGQPLDDDIRRTLHTDGPWRVEPRIGLARHGHGPLRGTGMAGMLYTGEHLRPVEDMRFLLGCENPAPVTVANEVVYLGGRGRLARVRVDRYADPYPAAPATFPDGRLSVYLVTPALVDDVLWRPAGTSARLCALAVNGPHPVATATPGKEFGRSRQLVWTVPAGSVYYLEFATAQDAATWSAEHHGGLIPAVSADTNPIVTAGFGTCLTGSW